MTEKRDIEIDLEEDVYNKIVEIVQDKNNEFHTVDEFVEAALRDYLNNNKE